MVLCPVPVGPIAVRTSELPGATSETGRQLARCQHIGRAPLRENCQDHDSTRTFRKDALTPDSLDSRRAGDTLLDGVLAGAVRRARTNCIGGGAGNEASKRGLPR